MSVDREGLFQIGEVTDRVGLSLRTVRYYEEVGLVTPSARTEGGFRLYSEADVQRLLLIKSMKAFDLKLEEMGDLLEVLDGSAVATTLEAAELDRVEAELEEHVAHATRLLEKRRLEFDDAEALRALMIERISGCKAARAGSG